MEESVPIAAPPRSIFLKEERLPESKVMRGRG
jgi:hypothetical protein